MENAKTRPRPFAKNTHEKWTFRKKVHHVEYEPYTSQLEFAYIFCHDTPIPITQRQHADQQSQIAAANMITTRHSHFPVPAPLFYDPQV